MDNSQTQTCNTCNRELDVSQFAVFFSTARNKHYTDKRCRICKNKIGKELMRQKAEEKRKEKQNDIQDIVESEEEPEVQKILTPEEAAKRERQRARSKEHYEKNKQKILERSKKYKAENKEKINANRRRYLKKKMKDPLERLKRSMKTLLLAKLKKTYSSSVYFGVPITFIKKWLEYNFTNEMSWDNYGTYWHIDHVIAVNLWNLADHEEVLACFNWKNLMPLEKEQNLRKAAQFYPSRVFLQEHRIRLYRKEKGIDEDIKGFMTQYNKKTRSLLPEFYMRHTPIAGTS